MSLDLATVLGADLAVIAPLVVVVLVAAAIIVADLVAPGQRRPSRSAVALLGLAITAALIARGGGHARDRVRRLATGSTP